LHPFRKKSRFPETKNDDFLKKVFWVRFFGRNVRRNSLIENDLQRMEKTQKRGGKHPLWGKVRFRETKISVFLFFPGKKIDRICRRAAGHRSPPVGGR
jgi:hypothetical protein